MIVTYLLLSLKPKQPRDAATGRFLSPNPQPVKPKTPAIEKNPLAWFNYPMSDQPWNSRRRVVRVISADSEYLTGLELVSGDRWQFKKYRQSKITNMAMEFNPGSMS